MDGTKDIKKREREKWNIAGAYTLFLCKAQTVRRGGPVSKNFWPPMGRLSSGGSTSSVFNSYDLNFGHTSILPITSAPSESYRNGAIDKRLVPHSYR